MSDRKPSRSEEEYFAREEAEKLHRLHEEKIDALSEHDKEERKKLHWMKCSKCGYDLQRVMWRDVELEKCFQCGALVLDQGELEKLAGEEDETNFLRDVFSMFKL